MFWLYNDYLIVEQGVGLYRAISLARSRSNWYYQFDTTFYAVSSYRLTFSEVLKSCFNEIDHTSDENFFLWIFCTCTLQVHRPSNVAGVFLLCLIIPPIPWISLHQFTPSNTTYTVKNAWFVNYQRVITLPKISKLINLIIRGMYEMYAWQRTSTQF